MLVRMTVQSQKRVQERSTQLLSAIILFQLLTASAFIINSSHSEWRKCYCFGSQQQQHATAVATTTTTTTTVQEMYLGEDL